MLRHLCGLAIPYRSKCEKAASGSSAGDRSSVGLLRLGLWRPFELATRRAGRTSAG
jgi:hypothetical protein